MPNHFYYSKDKSLNGIFKSFMDAGVFWENIDYKASSISSTPRDPKHIFEYDNTEYWIGDVDQNGLINFTFSLKSFYIKPLGFELGTTPYNALPMDFQFSSSLDNITYEHTRKYHYKYQPSDVHFFSFTNSPAKFFRLTCLSSIHGAKNFDVSSIEIYGEYHKHLSGFNFFTCAHTKSCFHTSALILFSLAI